MDHQSSLLANRNRLLLLLGVVALCGALVACGRAAGKPMMPEPVEPTPVEPVAPTVPPYVASEIEMSLRTMLLALTDPQVLAVPQAEGADAAAIASCSMEATGDATDNDGDNYPVDQTRTYDCDFLFITGMATLMLMDKDDADPASGVKATAVSSYSSGGTEEPGLSFTTDVSLDASRSDAAAAHDYDIAYQGSGGLVTPFVETEFAGRYDVMLAGTFAAGAAGVMGGFTISTMPADCGTLDAAVQEECRQEVQEVQEVPGGNIQLGVTTTGLAYDAANCATTFTGGYFDVTDPGGNVIKSTYDGCGPATVTYNGQPIPPPETAN